MMSIPTDKAEEKSVKILPVPSQESRPDYQRRILTASLIQIKNENALDFEADTSEESIYVWDIKLPTRNERVVNVTLHFGPTYPFDPPSVFVKERLFHPNISMSGEVCLEDLKNVWTRACSISSLIASIQYLLSDPNPNDPVNVYAADMLLEYPESYHQFASSYYEKLDSFDEQKDRETTNFQNDENRGNETSVKLELRSEAEIRILADLKEIKDNHLFFEADASDESIYLWSIKFPAPNGRAVNATLYFGSEYPYVAPKIFIMEKLFHPNICSSGKVCLKYLEDVWTPDLSISTLISSVQCLLSDPNPHNPVNVQAARILLQNPEEYHQYASSCYDKLDEMLHCEGTNLENANQPQSKPGAPLRIQSDLKEIQNDYGLHFEVNPSEESIYLWNIRFPAPNGKAVNAKLTFGPNYPYVAPKIIIKEKLFHPNISAKGEVCFQNLKDAWTPSQPLWYLILSVQCLLSDPNPNDPVNVRAADMLLHNPELYHKFASSCYEMLEMLDFDVQDRKGRSGQNSLNTCTEGIEEQMEMQFVLFDGFSKN